MAWRLIGNKPLSEPMLTRFTDTYMLTDTYMRHLGEMTLIDTSSTLIEVINDLVPNHKPLPEQWRHTAAWGHNRLDI